MSNTIIEILPENEDAEKPSVGSSHNTIIFCEKPWRVPAMVLSALVICTFIWGLFVLDTWRDGEDDYARYDFSVSEALFKNTGLNNQMSFADVVAPAVVGIAGERVNSGITGRGSIIDSSGHVLTSLSLVNGLNSIKVYVQANDGLRVYDAQIVKSVPAHDMVVIKLLTRDRFLFFNMGDANAVAPNQQIYAFANNMQGQTQLAQGLVAVNNQQQQIDGAQVTNLLATDVMFQPQQMGGPIINRNGEMIGMGIVLPGVNGRSRGFMIPSSVIQGHFRDVVNFNQAGPLRPVQPQQVLNSHQPVVAAALNAPVTFQHAPAQSGAAAWWKNAQMQLNGSGANVDALAMPQVGASALGGGGCSQYAATGCCNQKSGCGTHRYTNYFWVYFNRYS